MKGNQIQMKLSKIMSFNLVKNIENTCFQRKFIKRKQLSRFYEINPSDEN